MTLNQKLGAIWVLWLCVMLIAPWGVWLDRKVFAEPASTPAVRDDFTLSKDTQLAIVRIWSVMYDDEQYGQHFAKNRSMADAVFAYLIDRDNELTIKNDRYRRSAIYDAPGPLPEDGIVPSGQ